MKISISFHSNKIKWELHTKAAKSFILLLKKLVKFEIKFVRRSEAK